MLRTIFVLGLLLVGLWYALRSAFYSLLLYLWIAYFRPEDWVWGGVVQNLNMSFFVGILVVLGSLVSRVRFRFGIQALLLFAFLGVTLVSALHSVDTEYSWPFWKEFAKAVVISYLIAVHGAEPAHFRRIVLVMGLSLGVEAAKQGWGELLGNPSGMNFNPIPFLGDNNGVAVGMVMMASLLGALAQTAKRKWERRLHYFLAVGTILRAISTYSRGGFLACGTLGFLHLLRSPHKLRAFGAIALVAGIVVAVVPDAYWDRMATIEISTEQREESAASRIHFWRVAVDMANANPLIGAGHNAYNVAYDAYDFSAGQYGRGRSVHSAWFGVLAEQGYPGLMLFVAIFALALRSARRARRIALKNESLADVAKFATAVEASLVTYAVGGCFVPLQYLEMFWHIVGLAMALDWMTRDPRFAARAPERTAAADPARFARPAVGA